MKTYMIEELLSQEESKTLEFKQNLTSPTKVVKTAIAFANTSGGTIIIGIEDGTKAIVGLANVLEEEERIANMLFDLIEPTLIPDIDIINYQNKELLIINIPHIPGPFYLKKSGIINGTYIRYGSSNRLADPETLANLQRLAKRISFDELVCPNATINDLDKQLIDKHLKGAIKSISDKHYESLGLISYHGKKKQPTYGGLLLFNNDKTKWLPDAVIRCVCFASVVKDKIIDKREISTNLIDSVDETILFVQRNTKISAHIGTVRRIDDPEYPATAIREAITNAIMHADYSIKGACIQLSIYSDRIEIINPGNLHFGQTLDSALSGVSKMRNPIIGRVFREIGIVESLGMGLMSIIRAYKNTTAAAPIFEEINTFFKVTLFAKPCKSIGDETWIKQLENVFMSTASVSSSEMAEIWDVSDRTARTRLSKLLKSGFIVRNAKSKNDPHATYSKS